jgi:hypothetical protein
MNEEVKKKNFKRKEREETLAPSIPSESVPEKHEPKQKTEIPKKLQKFQKGE